VHLSSSNYPKFDVNPNTGADHPEPGAELRKAQNRVHFGGDTPSALWLPMKKS
jgi:predicted acyl esterase